MIWLMRNGISGSIPCPPIQNWLGNHSCLQFHQLLVVCMGLRGCTLECPVPGMGSLYRQVPGSWWKQRIRFLFDFWDRHHFFPFELIHDWPRARALQMEGQAAPGHGEVTPTATTPCGAPCCQNSGLEGNDGVGGCGNFSLLSLHVYVCLVVFLALLMLLVHKAVRCRHVKMCMGDGRHKAARRHNVMTCPGVFWSWFLSEGMYPRCFVVL